MGAEHESQSIKTVENPTSAYKVAGRGPQGRQPSIRDDSATDVIRGASADFQTRNSIFAPRIYSPSGFDMINILMRVATRPHPVVDLGAIDFDCALVLCDTLAHDDPIVYCSKGFEILTQYHREEILGRNCRFLQSPPDAFDSAQQFGRTNVKNMDAFSRTGQDPSYKVEMDELNDEQTKLLALREHIARREETQVVITNYRKDGTSFQNILTTVPVLFDSDLDHFRYIVGFQADQNHCAPNLGRLKQREHLQA